MVALRDKQIESLGLYLNNPRFLDLSDPGTGKTPPVCVYLAYHWFERGCRSVWTQPKSLLGKNKRELLRFTDFEPDDVVILERNWALFEEGKPSMDRVIEEQYADEVIITETGEIVPEAEAGDRPFTYRWIYIVTDPKDTGLDIGTPIFSDVLKAINDELPKKGKVKARRTFNKRQKTIKVMDLIAAKSDAKVFLCSFHFLREHWQKLLDTIPNVDCLAVDELHMGFGGTESQATQSLYGFMRKAKHFIGMTGTLMNGRLDSVYPAIHVIEPRYYTSYADFRAQHVLWEDDYGNVKAWKNESKVANILLRHGVRRTFAEVYGEEDVVFLPEDVDMNPMMAEQYALFHEQAMLELEDGQFLDGSMPAVATIRASQILAHPETMGLCRGEMTGKDERLEIAVQDAIARNENLLIFSVLVPEQQRIVELLRRMGRNPGLMNAGVSLSRRNKIDQAFISKTITDVVGSPQTMAVGWNWEHVDHVINVSYTYQDVDWLQAYRRASRGTRTKTLRVSYMRYVGTVDERKLGIISEKSILANKVDSTRPILRF